MAEESGFVLEEQWIIKIQKGKDDHPEKMDHRKEHYMIHENVVSEEVEATVPYQQGEKNRDVEGDDIHGNE
jgi:hypothetical protein